MQFLLWLRKSKLNKAGTAPIYLRIFLDTATRSEFATGIRCRPDEWNAAKGRLRGNDEAARAYNKKLKKIQAKAELKADRLQDAVDDDASLPAVTPAAVALALRPKAPKTPVATVLCLLRAAIPHYSPRPASRVNATHALTWWGNWPAGTTLVLAGLTVERATAFVHWLSQQPGSVSSKRTRLGILAGLLATAAPTHPRVFAKLTRLLGQASPSPGAILPEGWQEQLTSLKLPRVQALARDVFLLQYYLHGSRLGVILELQWGHIDEQQGRVRFTTHKSPIAMDMALRPEVRQILGQYPRSGPLVLPLLPRGYLLLPEARRFEVLRQAESSIGIALKNIARKLGWPHLKSHLARHTLALNSYLKNGKDLRVPQQLLGHKHISTTAAYIAGLSTAELDKGAANAYD